ncbi:sugar-binding transcriptional regulator [Tessaracoccus massiliensis]|uniref:sugar-binding transcriptional regulator n=1 Tax=Tessaracoccus massiliensis TaxID=1522311 RepID=UPI00058DBBF5|nr:sugar-binding domain-containing protein [Tessaracoccus massiliensis]
MLTPTPNDLDLVVRAAWLYYEDGLTQAQVAKRLFVSRQTVGRLLEAARQHGIVRIEMDTQYLAAMQLATQLKDASGLSDVIVVPTAEGRLSRERTNERVAAALAAYARRHLHPGAVVGVSWGDSVARALVELSEEHIEGVQFVACAGELSGIDEVLTRSPGVMRRLRTVPAPLLVSSASMAQALAQENAVREVLDLARSAVVTLTGMGSATPGGSAVLAGVTTDDEVAEFAARGAVGDMLGEWYDANGRVVETSWSERRIGVGLDELRGMSNVVGVAGGVEKVAAIRGAVRGGLIDALVTDEPTAQALLGP